MVTTMTQVFRPKFILMALSLVLCYSHMTSGGPIPDVELYKDQASSFFERFMNTFVPGSAQKDDPKSPNKGEKLTNLEIAGVIIGAIVLFFILLCCIGYCLCECVKELICCICCCCRDWNWLISGIRKKDKALPSPVILYPVLFN